MRTVSHGLTSRVSILVRDCTKLLQTAVKRHRSHIVDCSEAQDWPEAVCHVVPKNETRNMHISNGNLRHQFCLSREIFFFPTRFFALHSSTACLNWVRPLVVLCVGTPCLVRESGLRSHMDSATLLRLLDRAMSLP